MKRCMIVDDSSVIRKVAKRILGGTDMTVVEASNAHEALAICAVEMPDIVVVDSSLPDMDTTDLIRQLSSIEAAIKPHIVISMIQFNVGAIMRAKRAGASGYILKPFDRKHLLERFREMQIAA